MQNIRNYIIGIILLLLVSCVSYAKIININDTNPVDVEKAYRYGLITHNGTISNNIVNYHNTAINNGLIFGCIADKGSVCFNDVCICDKLAISYTDPSLSGIDFIDAQRGVIFAGCARTGRVKYNTLSIRESLVVSEEMLECNLYGGFVRTGTVEGNRVSVFGTIVVLKGGIGICGGRCASSSSLRAGDKVFANGNTVSIMGSLDAGQSSVNIDGGRSFCGHSNDNVVYICDSGNINAGWVFIYGGSGMDSQTSGNTVNMSGKINAWEIVDIIGGNGEAWGGSANGNNVYILGEIVALRQCAITGGIGYEKATNNTVTIFETAKIPTNCEIFGGFSRYLTTGNTLRIYCKKCLEVQTVAFFQHLEFILFEEIHPNDTILSFKNYMAAKFFGVAEFDVSKIGITIELSPKSPLNPGDEVHIIHCEKGIVGGPHIRKISGESPLSSIFGCRSVWGLDASGQDIMATLLEKEIVVRPEVKSYSEGIAGGLVFVNQGADFLAGKCIDEFQNIDVDKIFSFGAISLGNSKYKTGGHINVYGLSCYAGIGKAFEFRRQNVVAGIFFEYGNGDYKTQDNFESSEVKAEGTNQYYSVGLLGETKIEHKRLGELHFDGSIRLGNIKTDYKTEDIPILSVYPSTDIVTFNYGGLYFGSHLGLGYYYKIDSKNNLNIYGRYAFAIQEGKYVYLQDNEKINFDTLASNRIRIGAKIEQELRPKIKMYIGTAIEQEFSGKINAKVKNRPTGDVTLDGTTYVGEIGLNVELTRSVSIDLNGEGSIGNRESLSSMLKIKYFI